MAVSQSNTMWVKKGEKLPDGTTAKKGVLWNRKTGKRVTGKVKLVQDGAKNRKTGEKVAYKGGRAVTVKARNKTQVQKNRSGTGPTGGVGGDSTTGKRTYNPGAGTKKPKQSPVRDKTGKPTYNPGSGKTAKKIDSKGTSATVSAAQKTEKPRSSASVKGRIDDYKSGRRNLRSKFQNATRPIKLSAKDIKTKAQAEAVLASKNASASLKAAARRVIEGR